MATKGSEPRWRSTFLLARRRIPAPRLETTVRFLFAAATIGAAGAGFHYLNNQPGSFPDEVIQSHDERTAPRPLFDWASDQNRPKSLLSNQTVSDVVARMESQADEILDQFVKENEWTDESIDAAVDSIAKASTNPVNASQLGYRVTRDSETLPQSSGTRITGPSSSTIGRPTSSTTNAKPSATPRELAANVPRTTTPLGNIARVGEELISVFEPVEDSVAPDRSFAPAIDTPEVPESAKRTSTSASPTRLGSGETSPTTIPKTAKSTTTPFDEIEPPRSVNPAKSQPVIEDDGIQNVAADSMHSKQGETAALRRPIKSNPSSNPLTPTDSFDDRPERTAISPSSTPRDRSGIEPVEGISPLRDTSSAQEAAPVSRPDTDKVSLVQTTTGNASSQAGDPSNEERLILDPTDPVRNNGSLTPRSGHPIDRTGSQGSAPISSRQNIVTPPETTTAPSTRQIAAKPSKPSAEINAPTEDADELISVFETVDSEPVKSPRKSDPIDTPSVPGSNPSSRSTSANEASPKQGPQQSLRPIDSPRTPTSTSDSAKSQNQKSNSKPSSTVPLQNDTSKSTTSPEDRRTTVGRENQASPAEQAMKKESPAATNRNVSKPPGSTDSARLAKAVKKSEDWKVVGKTTEGRPLHTRRFGEVGPRTLIVAGLDGEDRTSVAWVDRLAEELASNSELIESSEVLIFRAGNPDGLTHKDSGNAHGVLINRNFPSRRYRSLPNGSTGSGPATEPETRAILEALFSFHPRRVIHLKATTAKSTVFYNRSARDIAGQLERKHSLEVQPIDMEQFPGSLEDFSDSTIDAAVFSMQLDVANDWQTAWPKHRDAIMTILGSSSTGKMEPKPIEQDELARSSPDALSSPIPISNLPSKPKSRTGYEELPPPPK